MLNLNPLKNSICKFSLSEPGPKICASFNNTKCISRRLTEVCLGRRKGSQHRAGHQSLMCKSTLPALGWERAQTGSGVLVLRDSGVKRQVKTEVKAQKTKTEGYMSWHGPCGFQRPMSVVGPMSKASGNRYWAVHSTVPSAVCRDGLVTHAQGI